MSYPYGYLIGSLIFLLAWLVLFLLNKPARRHMLILSLITGVFGPLSEFWYLKDYWQPEFAVKFPIGGLEDVIFGFAIGGIAAVAYETIFVNRLCLCEQRELKREWFFLVFAAVLGGLLVILTNIFGINSIYSSSLGFIAIGLIMLYFRRDLWVNAVGSGILVALTMFVIYIIPLALFKEVHQMLAQIWQLYGTSQGTLILGHVPVTEMIWGFSWGFVWGPIYEFMVGARTMKLRVLKR